MVAGLVADVQSIMVRSAEFYSLVLAAEKVLFPATLSMIVFQRKPI